MPASKTKKHKESNRHRFLTFSERLSQVSIDAIHRIKRPDENDQDEDSRFHTTFLKWRDQDRSLHFQRFLSEISNKTKNYKMIVHYRDDIVSSLLKHLAVQDSLAVHALSELLVSLCVDLRSEFYPHFKDTFLILIKLMNTKDASQLEWIFNAISLIFKYLWRYMVADIEAVLGLYVQLLSGEHADHIALFAAESITFLIRKVLNQNNIFHKLFHIFAINEKSRRGLGKILFYVMKGVNGTLYSRTETIVRQMISCLKDDELQALEVFDSINEAFELVAQHVKKDNAQFLWDVILSNLRLGHDRYMLRLLKTWCIHGSGILILNSIEITEVLEELLPCIKTEDKIDLVGIIEVLTLTKHDNFADSVKIRLISSLIDSEKFSLEIILDFWRKTLDFVNGSTDCHRIMLKYCQINFSKNPESVTQLLCDYILSNSTLPNDAKEVVDYTPFCIDYALISRREGVPRIQEGLEKIIVEEDSKVSVIWMALLTIQHVRPALVSPIRKLKALFQNISSQDRYVGMLQTQMAITRALLQTGIILDGGKKCKQLLNLCRSCKKFLLSACGEDNLQDQNALFLLDMICSVDIESASSVKGHANLVNNLRSNLSSHDPVVRKFSLHILTLLYPDENTFKTCLLVEQTPATIQTYRTKAIHLDKLKYSSDLDPEITVATLRFLVSNLYINFSSYWPIVQKKISSFIPGDKNSDLWPLLFELLARASSKALFLQSEEKGEKSSDDCFLADCSAGKMFVENGLKVMFSTQANVRIDHFNYRMLLWKTLTLLPVDILEKYNRHIVTLFLSFLEEEYFKIDKSYAPYQNLGIKSKKKPSDSTVFGKNLCIKTLLVYLQVLAKFKNPAACFSAVKLRSIYEDFLMHGDAEVQKCALKCLLAYKEKTLRTFEEQLFSLLDDDKIKETMIQFGLEDIEVDKRSFLIPVLFRLLYGRIVSKSGTTGQPRKRRAMILRFLSGLTQHEMKDFIFLAIKPVKHFVNEDTLNMALDETCTIGNDLTEIVPLSRQQGILNTLSEIIEKHASLLSKFMFDYLLKLLLSFHLSYCRMISIIEALEDSSNFQRTLSFLRSLSKQSHVMVNTLVQYWPESEIFSREQIESIFYVLVNPHIHKLHHECISQPNSLLNFFNEISKQGKFFPIFGQKITTEGIDAPLQEIIKTLVSKKTSSTVAEFIMEMLVRLLGEKEPDMDDDLEKQGEVLCKRMLENVESGIISTDEISVSDVGLRLMVNYVAEILKYFINKLKDRKNSSVLIQSHLKLLIALGEHITDSELSNELTELMLGHLSGIARAGRNVSSASEQETIYPALTSLVAIPLTSTYIQLIAKLFSRINSRECRLVLIQAFQKACSDTSQRFGETMKKVCHIIVDLNAWDKRFIEEVDYDSRLAGFQQVIDWLESDFVEPLYENNFCGLISLMHNCIFTLENHSNDLSLREMSSRSLELAIGLAFTNTSNLPDFYQSVIGAVILPAVKRGLNSTDENQRHEWLRLLVAIIKLSPNDMSFCSMMMLCNDSDLDADFFANVQHIQLHRRTRAFKKLAQIVSNEAGSSNIIPYSMVTSYLLPLAMQTLKCKDLSKHLHLRDACLDVISACAKIMPWPAYVKFLKQNMALMMRHIHGVKIVCSILYSFHFDIAVVPKESAIAWEESFVTMRTKTEHNKDGGTESKKDECDNDGLDAECETNLNNTQQDSTAVIYTTIVCDILPKLCDNLTSKLNSDSSHKMADSLKFSDIDQCTIRAPLAVAVVSLLRKLPERIMHKQLSTVILKIVGFLRHHYIEVRSAACKVVVQIVQLLDPGLLHIILKELKSGLTRGYQKHVLIHTVNAVFSQIEETLNVGDLERCLNLVKSILNDDLFGKGEEERGVEKIKSKIPEARGRSKAYNIYRVLAKFSKRESLLSLILPLKGVLDSTHDHKKRKIVESVLEEINQGLQDNSALTAEDILVFLHGLLTENLPGVFDSKKSETENKRAKSKLSFRPESCLLLSTEPERYGIKETKKTQKTNLHLLIEFSLLLLNSSLKRQVVRITKAEHLQMLDPFVRILAQCLDSAHSKTVTESIRCLTKLLKSAMPSLTENATDIIKSLFKVLRENSKGSTNNELAAATYKALSILCNSELGSKLSETQLQVLLGYAEEMLYERDRQSLAFNVIQSIVSRGLRGGEIIEVLDKVRDICIQTHDNAAMVHAREVYMHFLNNYPMTKTKLHGHLGFVLAQLTFEYESGRLSSLELIASIISSFPEALITSDSGMIFVPISAMLLNDESVNCRRLAAHVIKILLKKLEMNDRDQLFSLVMQWFADEDHKLHQQLAAMLVSVFVEVEEAQFRRHLPGFLPALLKVLNSVVEKIKPERDDDDDDDEIESPLSSDDDHFIFHQLSAFHAVLRTCNLSRDSSWSDEVSSLLSCAESFLLHPHTWIRIVASQTFGTLFSSWDPEELATQSTAKKSSYFVNINAKLNTLSTRFCQQIQSPVIDAKLAEQSIKNLLFIIRVYEKKKFLRDSAIKKGGGVDSEDTTKPVDRISILLFRLLKTAKREAANDIKETSKRTTILKFYAAACLGLKSLDEYLPIIVELIHRENERKIVEEDKGALSLKQLAGEVLEVVKSKVGSSIFTPVYASVQKRLTTMRRDRKRRRDVALVADPQRAAVVKRHRQQKKKDQRKRKIASFRPEYGMKLNKLKKRTADLDL